MTTEDQKLGCVNDFDDLDAGQPCGLRSCPGCGPSARAAAVETEQQANLPDSDDDPAEEDEPAAEPVLLEVSIAAFNRSVEIKAPGTLVNIANVALELWRATDDPAKPFGATGFVIGESSGPPPAEMTPRTLEPLDSADQAAA